MVHKIVITGAPASGKTLFIERLKKDKRFSKFVFFSELARKLLAENPFYRTDWSNFHRDIYNQQIEREKEYQDTSFISDRGTVDTFAFHPETVKDVGTDFEKEYNRYNAVIHLESSANLGDAFYETDDIRNESIDETLEIERKIKSVWSNHPKYIFIKAQTSFDEKYEIFLARLLEITSIS